MGRGKRKGQSLAVAPNRPAAIAGARDQLAQAVADQLGLAADEVLAQLGEAKPGFGDLALVCHPLARRLGRSPLAVASEAAAALERLEQVAQAAAVGPFANVTLKTGPLLERLAGRRRAGQSLLAGGEGRGQRLAIEFSSPNSARALGFHHLRGTALGAALARLYALRGYQVTRVNYLGDFGHNIGLLLQALDGVAAADEAALTPAALQTLYVQANADSSADPAVKERAHKWLQQLESGDPEALRRWRLITQTTRQGLEQVYERLGVTFDDWQGESLYAGAGRAAAARLVELGVAVQGADGAVYVPGDEDTRPIVLITAQGATTYESRDVGALLARYDGHRYDRSLYLTDVGQRARFEAMFQAAQQLDEAAASGAQHLGFGQMRLGGAKAKSREGTTLALAEVLDAAVARAQEIVTTAGGADEQAQRLAEQVGVGAVLFSQLRLRRAADFDFDLERAVSLEGATAARVQYTQARVQAILRKAGVELEQALADGDGARLVDQREHAVVVAVARLEEAGALALAQDDVSPIADALLAVADAWGSYQTAGKGDPALRVLSDDPELQTARLQLAALVAVAVQDGLAVLGVAAPARM